MEKQERKKFFSDEFYEKIRDNADVETQLLFEKIILQIELLSSNNIIQLIHFRLFIKELIEKIDISSTNDNKNDSKQILSIINHNLFLPSAIPYQNSDSFFINLEKKISIEIELLDLKKRKNKFEAVYNSTNDFATKSQVISELNLLTEKMNYLEQYLLNIVNNLNSAEELSKKTNRLNKLMDIPDENSSRIEKFKHREANFGLLKRKEDDINEEVGEVNFSVITPHSILPGDMNELYFVLYEKAFEKLLHKTIEQLDYEPNVYFDKLSLKRGNYKIEMRTSLNNCVDYNPVNWQGKYNKITFILNVPSDFTDNHIIVYFDLFDENNIRLLNFECNILIGSSDEPILLKHKIKRVFLSYSRKDLKEVLRIRQGMEALGNGQKLFLDIIDLKENSDWEEEIKKQIDNSDVFFLIWSKNSSAKKPNGEMSGVEKEYEYALERIKNNKNMSLVVINIDGINVPQRILDYQKEYEERSMIKAYISYSKDKALDIREIDYILLGMKYLCKANGTSFNIVNYKQSLDDAHLDNIDSCNIFYLMLSNSSTTDTNVESEYKYAIEKHGIDFVFAIPLEKTENIKVPKLLEKKHLNSTIVYIIDGLKK